MNQQRDIDKIHLYAKDPYEAKYQFLINKMEGTGLKNFNDFKAFIQYLNNMAEIYKNIEDYNPNKKRKILIIFDGMITDMLSNKKTYPVVTELYIRGRKLNISLFLIHNLLLLFIETLNKFYALFYHEHFKRKRTLTNCI